MLQGSEEAAELAARLARAVGVRGVVCLGCPLAGALLEGSDRSLISLSRPPLQEVRLELERLLLVATPSGGAEGNLLEACAVARVPQVWLPVGELLESLSLPQGGRYRRRSLVLPGDRVRLAGLPDVVFTPLPRH